MLKPPVEIVLEFLRNTTYETSIVKQNVTFYELTNDILTDAGLQVADYNIDTELQDFIVPYGFFTVQSHREALRKVTEACIGSAYCDGDGVLQVTGPSSLTSKTVSDLTITNDEYFKKKQSSEVMPRLRIVL